MEPEFQLGKPLTRGVVQWQKWSEEKAICKTRQDSKTSDINWLNAHMFGNCPQGLS